MPKGKKYQAKLKLVDRTKLYKLDEAVALLKQTKSDKFDESIDLSVKLGALKKGDTVRGTVLLPAGSGKSKKVAVITKGDNLELAKAAGADLVGAEDLVEKIKGGFLGFDVLLATPDAMSLVGKLGRVLGAKGLMPNPKSGTVTPDVAKTVKEFKAGKIEFKVDKTGVVNAPAGKTSFEEAKIKENLVSVVDAIMKAKPASAKGGGFIRSVTISATMGPGIKLELDEFPSIALAYGG